MKDNDGNTTKLNVDGTMEIVDKTQSSESIGVSIDDVSVHVGAENNMKRISNEDLSEYSEEEKKSKKKKEN